MLITPLDTKGLENRFNVFLRQKKITWKSIKIGNRITYTKFYENIYLPNVIQTEVILFSRFDILRSFLFYLTNTCS